MNSISFIWDLDGTLIDSYKVIVSSIQKLLNDKNIYISYEEIKRKSTERSVGEFLSEICPIHSLSVKEMEQACHKAIDARYLEVESIPHANEILEYLSNLGVKNYIYTHKGKSTHDILKNIDLYQYFEEIITIEDGFKRKPDPEAINYLVKKYNIDKNNAYYVGDRHLDIDSANNAGIKSIFFKPEDSYVTPTNRETHIVYDLIKIKDIIK